MLPSSAYQETQYVYGIATSTISSNDLLAQVWHPNKSTGAASSSEADVYDYNALGEVATFEDRNGSIHSYSSDVVGRRIYDWATTIGSGVSNSTTVLGTGYDGRGNPSFFAGLDYNYTFANSVVRAFNGWNQMTAEWQEHAGVVNPSASAQVQYAYSEMPSGANHSRLTSVTSPSGTAVSLTYASGVDDSISRVSGLSESGTNPLYSFDYLGLGTVVQASNPVTFRTVIGSGTGDAGDQYVGLDRFGRVTDLSWSTGGSGAAVNDRYQYGYDPDSNRLWRDNVQNSAFGELYAYDALNQLTSMSRGTLNSGHTALTGSASRSQSWTADGAGNFSGVTTDGTSQSRSYNAQNQFTALGAASPTYDANGNLTSDGTWTYTYDAWNRLVGATDGTTTVTYGYDALGRRITETVGGVTTHLYYNQNWQVIEERVGGTGSTNLRAQYVWSPVESDTLVYRDRDTNANGVVDERLYVQQDVQGNVTALVNTSGVVVERYAYDAYGKATPYTASWGTPSGGTTQYAWRYLHQGLRYDASDKLYDNRRRVYSADYMRFLQNDPIGFVAGDPDTYRYVGSNPIASSDPSGLQIVGTTDNPISRGPGIEPLPVLNVPGPDEWTSRWLDEARQRSQDDLCRARADSEARSRHTWNRIGSGIRWLGGWGEMALGAFITGTLGETGIGAVAGISLIVVGYDDIETGSRGMWSAAPVRPTRVRAAAMITDEPVLLLMADIGPPVLLGGVAFSAIAADVIAAEGATVTVTRWGRPGLESGDWVMPGGKTWINYTLSFKWQRGWGNEYAPPESGRSYPVPESTIFWPWGWGIDGWWKGLIFHQRRYIGPSRHE